MIFEIFHDLADVIRIANSCMTLPITAVVLYFFVANLVAIFSFIWSTINAEFFYISLSNDMVFAILNYASLSILTHASNSASQQAEEIAVTVSKIVNNANCSRIHQKVFKNFLHQHQYRNLKFENVFFVISWGLILAVSKNDN